jgi:two-component system, OmpR family, response regulator
MMALEQAPKRILLVDDEEAVRLLLRDCFELEGFLVSEAATGAELTAKMAEAPDLITLDLSLGGENGLELARQVRARCNVPIVMITGKGDTIDRVVGLELGADDYITKPFHLREVLARVRAVLRRYENSIAPASLTANAAAIDVSLGDRFTFEGWTLDIAKRELKSAEGAVVELTTAEFNMLEMFVNRPARVLSRDNIMDLLKGHDWSPLDRSIDSLLVRVRRKVEPSPDTPRLIKTVRGIGYVFAADVRKF